MVRLRIQLLGSFQVSLDGAPLTQFGANIARALLAYLAMNAGKHIPREIAASLLWPEHDQARALHNLRQALTRLRTVLGDQGAREPFLQITRETLCFCPQSPHWLDVAAFKERVTAARDHPHRDLATCPACVQQLEEAAALYGGSFLAGFYIDSIPFEEWLVVERERLHRLAMDVFYSLAEIERDWDNIYPAWGWAAAHWRIDLLARSIGGLQRFLLLRGRSQWGKLMFGMAVEMPELFDQFGGPSLRIRLLLGIVRFLIEEGHYAQAAAVAQTASKMAQQHQLPHLEAATTMELGAALREQGQYSEAQDALNQALLQARALHALDVVVRSLNWLGDLAGQQHDDQRAREILEEALHLMHDLDNALQEASLLNSLGCVATAEGHFTRALAYFDEALRLFRAVGSLHGESMTLHSLGKAWQALGHYATARACYEQSLRLARDLALRRGEVEGLISLASLLTEQGEERTAAAISQQAIDMARTLGDRAAESRALLCWGHALVTRGAWDEAARAYEQVLAAQRSLGQPGASLEAMAGLARAALGKGESQQAMRWIEEILRQAEEGFLAQAAEWVRVYWDCYAVLSACGDLRAAYALGMARLLLRNRADRIYDQEMRRSFLENVPLHRAIIAA